MGLPKLFAFILLAQLSLKKCQEIAEAVVSLSFYGIFEDKTWPSC